MNSPTEGYTVEIDVDYNTDDLARSVRLISDHAGSVLRYTRFGPGGGNPCYVLLFPNMALLRSGVTAFMLPDCEKSYVDEIVERAHPWKLNGG